MPAGLLIGIAQRATIARNMVSFSGGGGGAALGSPAGILVLLVVIAVVGLAFWLFNR